MIQLFKCDNLLFFFTEPLLQFMYIVVEQNVLFAGKKYDK